MWAGVFSTPVGRSEKIADDKIWDYPTVIHHSNTLKFLLDSSSNIRKLDIWH